MIALEDYLPLARLGKAHGLKGEIRIFFYPGMPGDLGSFSRVCLDAGGKEPRLYTVNRVRRQAKHTVVAFSEVTSRDEAQALTGAELLGLRTELPKSSEPRDAFWYEYEGLLVFDESGVELGRVDRLFDTGAHGVMVIAGGGREYLIPMVPEIVVEVDLEDGRMVVAPPAGLLEINV